MSVHPLITVLFILSIFNISCPAYGQNILERSEPSKPDWLADKTPIPGNPTFVYRIAEAGGNTLAKAQKRSSKTGKSAEPSGQVEVWNKLPEKRPPISNSNMRAKGKRNVSSTRK